MKKKVVSVILAMTMVASMAMGCGSSSDTTTSDNSTTTTTTNDAAASTEASDAADATADAANGDLADKKVGVCIYQFWIWFVCVAWSLAPSTIVILSFENPCSTK